MKPHPPNPNRLHENSGSERPNKTPRINRKGFTLVEVLTVITIISILMTAGAIGLGNLTAGKGTSSAIATCESLFAEARTIAISKRCKTRVLIDIDDPGSDNYKRRVVIAHEEVDANGVVVTGSWVLASRGYTMPTGTYFSTVYSRGKSATGADQDVEEVSLTSSGVPTAYRGEYAAYEFNSEGIFSEPGSSFIIAAGARPPGGEPRVTPSAERDFAGFVIWRNGRTSSYRSPDQMGISDTATDF